MKKKNIVLCIISLFFWFNSFSQENTQLDQINRSNYYDYLDNYDPALNGVIFTAFLSREEIISNVIQVFKDSSSSVSTFVRSYILYELENGEEILLGAYDRENDLGIVVNTGHYLEIDSTQRTNRIFKKITYRKNRKIIFKEYTNLPSNILVLQESWYWYQFNKINNEYYENLCNKSDIIEILKEDIRCFIAN